MGDRRIACRLFIEEHKEGADTIPLRYIKRKLFGNVRKLHEDTYKGQGLVMMM
jgi:hypothetical protein